MKNKRSIEPEYLKGAFLSHYFLADVLFSRYCTESEMRMMYDLYASIFCVHNEEWLEKNWAIISSDLFSLADNLSDFNRLVRLAKQFPNNITSEENYLLSQKAGAVQTKADILLNLEDISFETLLRVIERKAIGGDTDCISLIGFLEYHGIFVRKNTVSAEKRVRNAALWNHLFSVLMGIAYTATPEFYHKKLCAILHGAPNSDTLLYLQDVLHIPQDTQQDKIAAALEYAFCQGTLQACKLNADAVRILTSCVLTDTAKSKLIKSARSKETFPPEIPRSAAKATELKPDFGKFTELSDARATELDQIRTNLSMIDLRASSAYKPLLLICKDELVLDFYKEAVKACFSGAPLTQITLSEGETAFFSHSADNIFLAAMEKAKDKNVVLLIDRCETLNAEGAAELSHYLKISNRKRYKTHSTPSVDIDLSGILPILFSSSIPEASIVECCDSVFVSELSPKEFRTVLENELKKKKDDFRLSSLSMEPAVSDFLYDYSASAVTSLLNHAIGKLRQTSRDIQLTVPVFQRILDDYYRINNNLGFWRKPAI